MDDVEQSAAKVQLAALKTLDPMGPHYVDKLGHMRCAVGHHVYEEEDSRFLDLQQKIDAATHAHLTSRYQEEYSRYAGQPAAALAA